MLAQPHPGIPGPWGRWVGEESEVAPAPPRRALDEPGEPSRPFGVDPVAGIARSEDLLDSAEVNPGAFPAYHAAGYPISDR